MRKRYMFARAFADHIVAVGDKVKKETAFDCWGAVPVDPATSLMVLGSVENASLIAEACAAAAAGQIAGVRLAGPRLAIDYGHVDGPLSFRVFVALNTAASIGGWHLATLDESIVYRMAVPTVSDTDRVALLRTHPVWPFLEFAGDFDESAAACVMACVLDPRWYVGVTDETSTRPNSNAPLRSYLGVRSSVVDKYVSGRHGGDPRVWRLTQVVAAWSHQPEGNRAVGNPFKAMVQRYGHSAEGILRASRLFVDYLHDAWLHSIYRGRYGLFDPDTFFCDDPGRAKECRKRLCAVG